MRIVAAIVTHRRPVELARLLNSLGESNVPLAGCVISDHAPDGTTRSLAASARFETIVLENPANPGPGAGWAEAAKRALASFPDADAIWYLDDDVVVSSTDLGTLLEEMARANADAIAPLLEDASGKLWGFPEPLESGLRRPIRAAHTHTEALALLGDRPHPFCWCTGACFLVKRSAMERHGEHRRDFWLLGEDLEYSMRFAEQARAVFTCKVSVPHLPPAPASAEQAARSDYLKFCSLLQNLSYLSFHSAYSRHMKRYLPGNFRRFLRSHRPLGRTAADAAACFWNGAIRGEPAGRPSGVALRDKISRYVF
jgi:GT2 family glycosyltransferase